MCTAILFKTDRSFFLRNMDLDYSFGEEIIFTPRKYNINFKVEKKINSHYSILGIGTIIDNYPLYADAINEKGLAFAALNFEGNAVYKNFENSKLNLTPYELPLYLLSSCETINEVKAAIKNLNILNINFKSNIKLTPLHFMVSDCNESIVIESTLDGLKIYDNEFNILTNNPPFPYQVENLKNYLNLSIYDTKNNIIHKDLKPFSYNQGLIGLPGDFSSQSRFVRGLILKNNIKILNIKNDLFYLLDNLKMLKGIVVASKDFEYTRYSCVIDLHRLTYSFKTYVNPNITTIYMKDFNFDETTLIRRSL